MSKHHFEQAEFERRHAAVRSRMKEIGIDLLLAISPVSINYLVGSTVKGYQHLQCLFFTADPGPLRLMTKEAEVGELIDESLATEITGYGGRTPEDPVDVFNDIMRKAGLYDCRIGLEIPQYYITPQQYIRIESLLGDALMHDATSLVDELKLVKSDAEIALVRQAAEIADAGIRALMETAAPGVTEFQVAGAMQGRMIAMGGDAPPSPMNLSTGYRTAYAHGKPTMRILQDGDFIHTEFGAAYRQYCSTIGRQFCIGKPAQRMKEVYQAVRDACDACIAEMRAGVPVTRPHEAAKAVLTRLNLDRYRLHTTGYSVGPGFPPRWNEVLNMVDGSPHVLESGMIVSVEPPVFIHEEKIGARIIDNVLITDSGAEILSTIERDLILV